MPKSVSDSRAELVAANLICDMCGLTSLVRCFCLAMGHSKHRSGCFGLMLGFLNNGAVGDVEDRHPMTLLENFWLGAD